MSYSGNEHLLCKNGHLSIYDCYDAPDTREWKCSTCGEKCVWWNAVNYTNGSYEEYIGRKEIKILKREGIYHFGELDNDTIHNTSNWDIYLDEDEEYWYGYTEEWDFQKVRIPVKLWKAERIDGYIDLERIEEDAIFCKCCGHRIGEDRYKIPEGKGHLIGENE
jgi:DNA-directed RNA polymerase subunit RPC12/RpoP